MSAVFLDTVGLLALWSRSDQWHSAAKQAFARVHAARRRLLTSTFVLLECGNAAARRPFRSEVNLLRQNLEAEGLLVAPTEADWHQGWAAFQRGDADQAGIVDQVSFAIMARLGIVDAFTNDHHFRAAGLRTLF